MSFYQKYDLERLIADGDAKTFRAKENATGRDVFLHLFNPGGERILAAIKDKLGGAAGKPMWPLLEIGDFAGSPYAVTDVIERFTSLREWIATIDTSALPAAPPRENAVPPPREAVNAPTPPAPVTPLREPAGSEARPSSAPRAPVDAGRAAPLETKPAPKRVEEAGEFTRMFELPAPKAPKTPTVTRPQQAEADTFESLFGVGGAVSPAKPPQTAPAPQTQSDTFENLFGGGETARPQGEPRPSPAQTGQANDRQTGEFTRLFGRSPLGESINIEEEQARAARATPPENRPFQAPGEFTRMFGPQKQTPTAQTTQPAPPMQRPISDNASGIFAKPKKPMAPSGGGGAAGQSNTAASSNAPPEPGEYTRIIGTPAETEKPPAALAPPEPVAVQPPAVKKGLIIGLSIGAAVLVIAIIVIVILATRAK